MHSKSAVASYYKSIEHRINRNETRIMNLEIFMQVLELYYVGDTEGEISNIYGIVQNFKRVQGRNYGEVIFNGS